MAYRIEKREEIKSRKIHNAFRTNGNTKISERTITKALQELEDEGTIKRKGHGPSTVCMWNDK